MAMLTSVLKSKPAVEVNISIMRAFVVLRQHLNNYQELSTKISELETEMEIKFNDINQALRFLLQKEEKSKAQMERSKIGFIQES